MTSLASLMDSRLESEGMVDADRRRRLGVAGRGHVVYDDREDLDVAEVAPNQEAKNGHGLEDLLEHERDPIALGNRDYRNNGATTELTAD